MKSLTMWMYRRLAYAFPHEFQMVYGADLLQLGEDALEDIWRQHGFLGLIRLLVDIAVRVPIEYLSEMRRDLAYSLRTLAKSRGFAAVGIISLGLGMGVTASIASEFANLILRDTPGARDPGKLVMVQGASYPYFERYRDQHDLFAGAAVFIGPTPFNVSFGGANAKAGRIFGHIVSPDYLSVIGVRPARGRLFDPSLDKPGSAPVVFISDRFWRQRMDSEPDAVGRTIHVNGQTATIVGIGPKDFLGVSPILPAEIFVPATSPANMVPELAGDVIHKNDVKSFNVLLRMAPGVTDQTAEAGLDAITHRLDQETLDPARNAKERRITLLPGGKMVPMPRGLLPVLLAFVVLLTGLIVAIACMNLANMQLARATARRREVSIRLAVGASRFRLIRQLVTESVMLALAGGVAAILMAYWAASAMRKINFPGGIPINFDITPDWRILAFTFALSLVAGVGFGLAPALATTKADLASALKEGAVAQMRGHRRFSLRNVLMVCQVAGSLTLLLLAGVLVIGSEKTNRVEIPFDSNTMYLLSLDPVRDGYSAERTENLFGNLADQLKGVPGVRDVALAEAPPFGPQLGNSVLTAPAGPGVPDNVVSGVAKNRIGAGYFAALSVPMAAGREFDTRDQRLEASKSTALPVVVNETAARSFFETKDPIGRRISDTSGSYQVVGVIKDLSAPLSSNAAGVQVAALPVIYLPLIQTDLAHPPASGMIVMVRANSGTDTMAGVRRELAAIDPNLAIFNVRTLAHEVEQTSALVRVNTFLYGAIGTFGMVLAAIGLAGVTAYSVARRNREIGIRMALGASKGQVLRLVLGEGGGLVLAGTLLGFIGAFGVSQFLSAASSLFGPSITAGIHDLRLIFGAPLLLAGLAMLACYVPARRSTKIDPLIALRQE